MQIHANRKVTTVGGSPYSTFELDVDGLTYPIPGVPTATPTHQRPGRGPCAKNCAQRIEVRHSNVVTEFIYSNSTTTTKELNKVAPFCPGRISEPRNGETMLDLSIVETGDRNR